MLNNINMELENIGTKQYLVYKVSDSDTIDSLSLGMLTNNQIPALINANYSQMDSDKFVKYDISNQISAERVLSEAISKKRLLNIVKAVLSAIDSAEEYMLNPATILFDLNYIFVNSASSEVHLICLPLQIEDSSVDLYEFFKRMMFSVQFDQSEDCTYVTKFINYFHDEESFSLSGFRSLVKSIESEGKKTVKSEAIKPKSRETVQIVPEAEKNKISIKGSKSSISQNVIAQDTARIDSKNGKAATNISAKSEQPKEKMSFFYLLQHYSKENLAIYKAQRNSNAKDSKDTETKGSAGSISKKKKVAKKSANMPANKPNFAIPGVPDNFMREESEQISQTQEEIYPQVKQMDFGETTVLVDDSLEGTTVLNADNTQMDNSTSAYLIRMKNDERILIDKDVFVLGKGRNYADYVISDNTAISRKHASIITRGDCFYVVDLKSTNRTYVDDSVISSDVEVEISDGTILKLADECFEFKIY